VKQVIDGHPEALRVAEKDDGQEKWHRHTPENEGNKWDTLIDCQRERDGSDDQLGDHKVHGNRAGIVARFPLKVVMADGAIVIHLEKAAEQLSLTAHGTAQAQPARKKHSKSLPERHMDTLL